jgi:hypothetical protein
LPQLLSHAAVLPRELAVASRRFQESVPMTIAVFGCFRVRLRGSLVSVCGFVQAVGCTPLGFPRFSPLLLGSFTGAECLFGGPPVRVRFGLVPVSCVGH